MGEARLLLGAGWREMPLAAKAPGPGWPLASADSRGWDGGQAARRGA